MALRSIIYDFLSRSDVMSERWPLVLVAVYGR